MAKDKQKKRRLRGGRASNDPEFGGSAKPYEGVGRTLALAREQIGETLEDVAAHLRIRQPYLQAIEEGRFEDLPGRIYAIGFLRSYGEYLGLDEAAVVTAFKAESTPEPDTGRLNFPVPPPESRMPGTAVVAFALIAGIAIYGGWAYVHRHDVPGVVVPLTSADGLPPVAPAAKTVEMPLAPAPKENAAAGSVPSAGAGAGAQTPTVPGSATKSPEQIPPADQAAPAAQAASAVPAGSPAATSPAMPAVSGTPAAPPAGTAGAAINSSPAAPVSTATPAAPTASATPAAPAAPAASASAPSPVAAATPPSPPPVPASSGQVYGVTQGSVRVVLVASADSWINIQTPSKVLVAGLVLKPGDRYRVPDQTGIKLWTGNLGGLEIYVDGKKLPTLGRTGEARRGISLDPERLLAGTEMGR